MISRASVGRNLQATICSRCHAKPSNRRCLAAAASGSFSYETGESSGVRFASRDLPGPTTHLAIVAKAGTRYQPLPGFSEALEKFAFKSTFKRSTLRITREAELLGGELSAYHSRENLVIRAKFLRGDLPYFTELLGEVISKTKYTRHEYEEEVLPIMKLSQQGWLSNTSHMAIDSAHGLAFHRGLGTPLYPKSSTPLKKYINEELLEYFSKAAYAKSNIAVVANGASHTELSKWLQEFFSDWPDPTPADLPPLDTTPSKYYGGEERIPHDSGNNLVIAFPGSSSFAGDAYKPELSVLAALLGGDSTIKWSPGFSLLSKAVSAYSSLHVTTTHGTYSDAGLLLISLSGKAKEIRAASKEAVKILKAVASGDVRKEDIRKAIASAKFKTLEAGESIATDIELTGAGLVNHGGAFQIDDLGKSLSEVTEEQVKTVWPRKLQNLHSSDANLAQAAKSLLDGRATVSAVGDLFVLPFAEEIGLNV